MNTILPIGPRAPTPRAYAPSGNPHPDPDDSDQWRAYTNQHAQWLHALRDRIPADVMAPQEVDRLVAILISQLPSHALVSVYILHNFEQNLRLWYSDDQLMRENDVVWMETETRLKARMQLPRITEMGSEQYQVALEDRDRAAAQYRVAFEDRQRTLLQLTTRVYNSRMACLEDLQRPVIIRFFEEVNDMSFYLDYPAYSDLPAQIARVRTYTRHTFPMIDNPGVPIYEYLAEHLYNVHGFCMYATPEAVETLVRTLIDTLHALRVSITRGLFRGQRALFAEQLRSITHNYHRAAHTRYPLSVPIYVQNGDPNRRSPLSYARYQFVVDLVRQYAGTAGKRAHYKDALYALAAVSRADPDHCPFACLAGCKDILIRIVAFAFEV
jgi:hypothetical protein